MSEMNVSTWKQFRVGDLFVLVNSKPYHTKDISFCDDGLNYVTRTMFDNGIKGCVEDKPDFVIDVSWAGYGFVVICFEEVEAYSEEIS